MTGPHALGQGPHYKPVAQVVVHAHAFFAHQFIFATQGNPCISSAWGTESLAHQPTQGWITG